MLTQHQLIVGVAQSIVKVPPCQEMWRGQSHVHDRLARLVDVALGPARLLRICDRSHMALAKNDTIWYLHPKMNRKFSR